MSRSDGFKHDDSLTSLLEIVDTNHRFRKYDAGYHHDNNIDVYIEYGFSDCKIYIPSIWKHVREPTKREILEFALMRINGYDVPVYGPRSLSYLKAMGKNIDDDRYLALKKNIDIVLEHSSTFSDWSKSRVSKKYVAGCFDLDLMKKKNIPIWGRNTYAVVSRRKL